MEKLISGKPIQVVKCEERKECSNFFIDEEALASILLRESIKNKKVCVLSIAGAFRKGKSFMLDFFLRYLNSSNKDSWLDSTDAPLQGFPWRGGSERETTGILMWSEPTIINLPDGEEVALLLMDTQGTFDSKSTVKQCATVFALSTMLSSVQVYNIQSNLQEDNLQHLQLFTEYGRLATESGYGSKPFEHSPDMHSELKNLRQHLRSCFSSLSCFLMPHPGLEVASNPKFDGRVGDINPPFIEQLKILVPSLVDPKNVKIKNINGIPLTGGSLFEYFKAYMKIYQGDTLPEPKSMLEATAEANNLTILQSSRDHYVESMSKICGPTSPYINPADLENAHMKYKLESLQQFENKPKMGTKDFCSSYAKKLSDAIDKLGQDFKDSNENKNVFNNLKTPGCLLIVMFVAYFLNTITELIGLSPMAKLIMLPFYMALLSLLTWSILMYAGQAPNIIVIINQATDELFARVITPCLFYIARLHARQIRQN